MKAYGNSRRCLVRNADGSFSTPWGLDVEPDQTLIYPDASDKAIVKALLDQVTKQLEDKGRVMLEHDILSFFIGSDWDKQAMENGNQVSEQEVVELVTLEIKAFEEKHPELYQEALLKAETTYKTSITDRVLDDAIQTNDRYSPTEKGRCDLRRKLTRNHA
ncbi:hypothetical protein QNE90_003899 [Vibrio alginolyticus]|nr:hypothetical protein [Vibrio alginolyticus]